MTTVAPAALEFFKSGSQKGQQRFRDEISKNLNKDQIGQIINVTLHNFFFQKILKMSVQKLDKNNQTKLYSKSISTGME
jgi:hypothetical protein